jgi:hypothetical protein
MPRVTISRVAHHVFNPVSSFERLTAFFPYTFLIGGKGKNLNKTLIQFSILAHILKASLKSFRFLRDVASKVFTTEPRGNFHFVGGYQFGRRQFGQTFATALEQELDGGVGLRVARELEPPSIVCGNLSVEHLHTRQLIQGLAGREPRGQGTKSCLEGAS